MQQGGYQQHPQQQQPQQFQGGMPSAPASYQQPLPAATPQQQRPFPAQQPQPPAPVQSIPPLPGSAGLQIPGKMRVRIDPDHIPSPVAVQEVDQQLYEVEPYMTCSRVSAPLATTDFVAIDQGECRTRLRSACAVEWAC